MGDWTVIEMYEPVHYLDCITIDEVNIKGNKLFGWKCTIDADTPIEHIINHIRTSNTETTMIGNYSDGKEQFISSVYLRSPKNKCILLDREILGKTLVCGNKTLVDTYRFAATPI